MRKDSAGFEFWVNGREDCNMYSTDCMMWVSAIITDGTGPVLTLKLMDITN